MNRIKIYLKDNFGAIYEVEDVRFVIERGQFLVIGLLNEDVCIPITNIIRLEIFH
jgi:hypothetical protein